MLCFLLQGNCQPALCSSGKLLDESGKCVSMIEQIRGLGYKLFVVFLPVNLQMVTIEDVQNLSKYISGSIEDVSLESMTDINITVLYHDYDKMYGKLQRISVSSHFVGNNIVRRDIYEDQLLFLFSKAWTVLKDNGTKGKIQIKPVLLGEEMRKFEQIEIEDPHEVIKLPLPEGPGIQQSTVNKNSLSTFPELTTIKSSRRKITYTENHVTEIARIYQWWTKAIFIDVTHSLTCPYVPMNISNTSSTEENMPMINFLIWGQTIRVSSKQKIAVVNGQTLMCLSLYNKLTSTQSEQGILEQLQYYMEAICVSLSVVCLLLSSLTYCVFPSLRSLPGMNNLSLCMSLAVAQTCLLITARWGVNENLPKGYCLMHAILLHYSWLASFAWMSVCCIHMFRVFTANNNKFTDKRSDMKRYLYYCLYGFGVPGLIVIATYAINASITSGKSSGYNSDFCFLDTRRSVWTLALSLLVPLGLLILTNSVMFVMTVRQIVHVSNMQEQSRSRGRQGVLTYMKLSSLTGLIGAVVVIAVQLNSFVISMLTSPLMALQGVFIFVSFTCNHRVRLLYRDLFNRRARHYAQRTEKTTSSGLSTVPTIDNGSSKPPKGGSPF